MKINDAVQIQKRIRKKYPDFDAEILFQVIDTILEYISEGDKGQVSIQPERLNPEDHIVDDNEMVCDSLNMEHK